MVRGQSVIFRGAKNKENGLAELVRECWTTCGVQLKVWNIAETLRCTKSDSEQEMQCSARKLIAADTN